MKYLFGILLLIHGLIHLMGFVKAFSIADIPQLTQSIFKSLGMLFLFTTIVFLITAVLFFLKNNLWLVFGIVGVIVSQFLILLNWQDAKFGTIANAIILIVVIVGYATWNFKNEYKNDTQAALENSSTSEEIIDQENLKKLPDPVRKYLMYVGVLGKPKVNSVRIKFKGEMRGKEQDWFPFTSEQYNSIENPSRLFFMEAKFKGLPTTGYHCYQDTTASMRVKLLSIFKVANNSSRELFASETVTFFNDICLFAPAALINDTITWETIDDLSVKAYFRNQNTTISAILHFNLEGQLVNFISEDRYDINKMEKYRFSTPVSDYKDFNGYKLPGYGEAIWHYPDGEFTYGKFQLLDVTYNVAVK